MFFELLRMNEKLNEYYQKKALKFNYTSFFFDISQNFTFFSSIRDFYFMLSKHLELHPIFRSAQKIAIDVDIKPSKNFF